MNGCRGGRDRIARRRCRCRRRERRHEVEIEKGFGLEGGEREV